MSSGSIADDNVGPLGARNQFPRAGECNDVVFKDLHADW